MDITQASLFSGVGGFDLAAENVGFKNLFTCEKDEFCNKILKYYWKNTEHYGDIKTTDFTIWRGKVDILTGGFPCQPFSLAGKRKGTEDDRHLWPEMLRAISEIQPGFVIGENVYGIVNWEGGLVFDQVQSDLENQGYEIIPIILPAAAVNAPHRRDRVWFIAANAKSKQSEWMQFKQREFGEQKQREPRRGYCKNAAPNSNSRRQPFQEYRETESGLFAEESFSNNWENFPTQSPICSGNDGISTRLDSITFPKWRNKSIKAYGNAIVPQIAVEYFKIIKLIIEMNMLCTK